MPPLILAIAIALAAGVSLSAQSSPVKRSDAVPALRFISVQPNVKLEVLDWGGSGRPLVLLAGLGNTAHVFDDMARALRANSHVYGITRRGFGKSSAPDDGYWADRLGDDVLAVMDSLHLDKPVLVGHSIAGEELSSIGSRHGDRVSPLVYLDAAAAYAFYDTTTGNIQIDANELRRKINALEHGPPSRQVIDELLTTILPAFERDLRTLRDPEPGGAPPPPPAPADHQDRASFAAFQAWRKWVGGFASPIAELREQIEELPDGSVGRPIHSPEDARWLSEAIIGGTRKYLSVSAPVLAVFASPHAFGTFASPAAQAAAVTSDSIYRARQGDVVNAFLKSLPNGRER